VSITKRGSLSLVCGGVRGKIIEFISVMDHRSHQLLNGDKKRTGPRTMFFMAGARLLRGGEIIEAKPPILFAPVV
jgi:hypothetical protein